MQDRPVDFSSSDVVVACKICSGRTPVSLERFQNDESIVDCSQCDAPMVSIDQRLTTTDPTDALTAAGAVLTLSWFHASTYEEWPPVEAAARDRAMHLGTYEAAIDTMLHRMDWMDDATVPYFLHRVTISPNANVNPEVHADGGAPGWGILALDAVTTGGFTVRRYINANEHRGSISLAVALEAIGHVQTTAIPLVDRDVAVDIRARTAEAALASAITAADAEHRAAVVAYDAKEPPPQHPDPEIQRLLEKFGMNERGAIDRDRDRQVQAAENTFNRHLREHYLRHGVSVERSEKASSALGSRARQTGESLHDLYRRYAPLMLDPDAVIATLAAREPYRSAVLET